MRRGASFAAGIALVACGGAEAPDASTSIRFEAATPPAFARLLEPPELLFPRDHGPHFDVQTEWWYYTGHLRADAGRHFAYQLTFFRRGLTAGPPPEPPGLATNQFYFAHLALTDIEAGTHVFEERRSRGAAELAGARAEPFRVWLDGWEAVGLDGAQEGAVTLRAALPSGGFELTLVPSKPLVLHGEAGLSAKSATPGNASAYVSHTRLRTRGTLDVAGDVLAVEGASWFDHEWSSSALGPDAVGWDWFSLQLDDGRELMLFQIRRADGSIEPVSGGTLVESDGKSRRIDAAGFELEVLRHWTSSHSGTRYPSRWRLRVPEASLEITIAPFVAGQEMRTSFTYWEGAVGISGSAQGRAVTGRGYVELTGYARSMQGVF